MILMNKSIFFSFTSFHRAAVVPVELNELMLLWSLCWACVSWQADYFINVYCIHWHVSVCLCSRAKELKRAREHETPQRSPLTMWHHSPDSSFLFHLYLRHFTTEIEKKKTHQCKHCIYYYFYSVPVSTSTCTTIFFFFFHILCFHWLDVCQRTATSTGRE